MAFKMAGFSGPFKKTYEGEVKSIPQEVKPIVREVQPSQNIIPNNRQYIKPVPYRSSYFKNPTTKQQKLDKKRKLDYKPQSSFKQAGTEDASPGGGKPPKLKKKAKTIAQRIKDLELHKQTNTKEYKDLIAQVNKGYSEQGNYDEID